MLDSDLYLSEDHLTEKQHQKILIFLFLDDRFIMFHSFTVPNSLFMLQIKNSLFVYLTGLRMSRTLGAFAIFCILSVSVFGKDSKSAATTERPKTFRRLIPADVLRGNYVKHDMWIFQFFPYL